MEELARREAITGAVGRIPGRKEAATSLEEVVEEGVAPTAERRG